MGSEMCIRDSSCVVHVKTAILTHHCAKTATAKELDLEEDELEGENIASLVSLDHIRELCLAHFQVISLSLVVKLFKTVLLHQLCDVKQEILLPTTQW